jgi:HK97 family phage major capsid protein
MNELILKLQKEAADLLAVKESAIVAANADGVTPEEEAKQVKIAEEANAKLKDTTAKLNAATETRDQKAALDAHVRREREPANPPLVQHIHVPGNAAPNRPAPLSFAGQRRSGAMVAFRGEKAEERAYRAGLWVAATQFGHEASGRQYADQFGGHDLIRATLTGSDNTRGGYFVPDVMDTEIVKMMLVYGVFRRLAKPKVMASDTFTFPRETNELTSYYVAEGAAPTSPTDQTYDAITLVAKTLAAYGKMSNNLSEDALIDLGDEWAQKAAYEFAKKEDDAGFNGTGASTYGGIYGLLPKLLAANAVSRVTATGHTTPGALTVADFAAAMGRLPDFAEDGAVWIMHKEVYEASIGALQLTAGGTTGNDIATGARRQYGGYPVVTSNAFPRLAAATTGTTPIVLANLRMAAVLGDRRQRVMRTGEINDDMLKQLTTMFVSQRYDINVHTITDPKDATAAGPVVGLTLG